MITLRLVDQHVLIDIATTIHLCECGGWEGVGGVEGVEVWRCGEGYLYSRGKCLSLSGVCTVKCDRQDYKLNIT